MDKKIIIGNDINITYPVKLLENDSVILDVIDEHEPMTFHLIHQCVKYPMEIAIHDASTINIVFKADQQKLGKYSFEFLYTSKRTGRKCRSAKSNIFEIVEYSNDIQDYKCDILSQANNFNYVAGLAEKQNRVDLELITTAKEITQAINEVTANSSNNNSSIQQLETDVTNLNNTKQDKLTFEEKYIDTIKRWEIKCLTGTSKEYGRFNRETQLFEANDVIDIDLHTAVEMLEAFSGEIEHLPNFYKDQRFKTTLAILGNKYLPQIYDSHSTWIYTSTIKSFILSPNDSIINNATAVHSFVYYTRNVHSIYGGAIRFAHKPRNVITFTGLINFKFIIGNSDVGSFDWDMSDRNTTASSESLFFMLNHWGNTTEPLTTQRTLTIHSVIYDKITNPNNPEYSTYNKLVAEAARKNIIIAQ